MKLLDVTSLETLTELGITGAQVAEEWRMTSDAGQVASTQAFGKFDYEAGYEGIRYLSARITGGQNFALFPDNYVAGSHALMLNSS